MKPKVEVEIISERENVLKVDGEIIGVSKTQYDALFHKHFLDRKFDEAFKAGQDNSEQLALVDLPHVKRVSVSYNHPKGWTVLTWPHCGGR